MELVLSLRPCTNKCESQGPAVLVEGKIERAHRHSPSSKVLVLGPEAVLISSRAMRLLLSGCTLHVVLHGWSEPTFHQHLLHEVKLAGERGEPMRQRMAAPPSTAGP